MGETVIVTPETLAAAVEGAGPGTILELSPGIYTQPVSLIGKKGTREAPIVLRASTGAIFDGELSFDDFTPRAEQVARIAQQAGGYPGLYDIAGDAMVRLAGCEPSRRS